MVSERNGNGYGRNYDYDALRTDRFGSGEYERDYEAERVRTSDAYRESLMSSLERPATRSRLDRSDERRYGFYMSNIPTGDNNYDKHWDAKHAAEAATQVAKSPKKRLAFIITYVVVAIVALIAVTLSVVGLEEKNVVISKTIDVDPVMASAEVTNNDAIITDTVASESEMQAEEKGGTNCIMLANGEIVEIEIPERIAKTNDKEKGFDKFCTWMNEVFGG